MAACEFTRRRQCSGAREHELDAFLRRRAFWEQSQRPAEPQGSTFGREPCCCLAGISKDRDCGEVALTRRPLDVMGARRRRGPPCSERLGAPLVCTHTPRRGRAVIRRASDERVTEAEAPRDLGGANEVEP